MAVLGQVGPGRLEALADDATFVARVDALAADLDNYLTRPLWYQQLGEEDGDGSALPNGIAYFSMEFGVAGVLPNYSGGLGILAGDHLKSASDLGLPLIAVGLHYRSGYFRQSLSADGWQHENYPSMDPQGLPLRLLTDGAGEAVLVSLALPDGAQLHARVWIAQVGRIPLLLLDSDIPDNDHDLRAVTDRLYGGDQEHRIKQEILAGIGGVRAIRAFTEIEGVPAPEVFHMNEGHAGFLGAERIRELIEAGLDFDTALTVVRSSTVFTTHTPVPAGIDRFPVEMVERYFGPDPGGVGSAPAARRTAGTHSRFRRRGRCRRSSTWRTWGCGWRSAPTGSRCCTVRSAGRCSTTCGRVSTRPRCPSVRSPTGCTRRPGPRRSGWNWVASSSAART